MAHGWSFLAGREGKPWGGEVTGVQGGGSESKGWRQGSLVNDSYSTG